MAHIKKHVTAHTLRHTYATHLLEDGLDIVSIKELLGHSFIETTMVYLHVAKTGRLAPFSPLDRLYAPTRQEYPQGCWLAQRQSNKQHGGND
jgi:integrase/recombinase XerD